jgi:hypothetical protein
VGLGDAVEVQTAAQSEWGTVLAQSGVFEVDHAAGGADIPEEH